MHWLGGARSPVRGVLVFLLGFLSPGPAAAGDPFEIQVYEGDINEPLSAGLETHLNFVLVGRSAAEFTGEVPPDDVGRLTLEPSFGVLEWWELGAYLHFAFAAADAKFHWGGFKLRSKWIVPRRLTGDFALGLNVELGRGAEVFGATGWDTEFRPIVAWARGRWLLAANPMFGWALSGAGSGAEPDFEPAVKARADTGLGFAVGVEYYAGLGRFGDALSVREQEHIVYAVADLVGAPFDLNLGVGRGLSDPANAWTLKAIAGFQF